jgi:hypothetical protein
VTPHRSSSGRGTLLIDRVFPGIGRVRRSSGTTDQRTFKGINAMLTELYDKGLHGPLEAIRDGKLRAVAAYSAARTSSVEKLPDAPAMETLSDAWADWVKKTTNASTRRQRNYAWTHFEAVLRDDAPVAGLTPALRELRETLEDHAPAFNRIRSAASAFLRDRVGRHHHLYLDLVAIPALAEDPAERTAPSIEQVIRIRNRLTGHARQLWWDLCLTGMGPAEMDGPWSLLQDRIEILGTKRKARVRIVPRLTTPARRAMGWKQFRDLIEPLGLQRYDGRRAFARLLEDAEIPFTRRKLYMGHALANVTDRYGRAELTGYVVQDAEKVLARVAKAEALVEQETKAAGRKGLRRA